MAYKNEAANHLYNLLFCDNAALLEKGGDGSRISTPSCRN